MKIKIAVILTAMVFAFGVSSFAMSSRPTTGGAGCVNDAAEICYDRVGNPWGGTGTIGYEEYQRTCYTAKANYCWCKYYGNACEKGQDVPDAADRWTKL